MNLPPISFAAHTVETGDIDFNRWFPMASVSPTHKNAVENEINVQRHSIESLIRITGYSKSLITSLEALQPHCAKYRAYVALRKNEAVRDMVAADLGSNKTNKYVLFAWHRDSMVDICERLSDFHATAIYQGSKPEAKKKALDRFHNTTKYRVLVINVAAANIKMDLTPANRIGFIESSWNMNDNIQAILRVHKAGQERSVDVSWFGLVSSIDDNIQRLIKSRSKAILKECLAA